MNFIANASGWITGSINSLVMLINHHELTGIKVGASGEPPESDRGMHSNDSKFVFVESTRLAQNFFVDI
jgi:hypothetical protein